MEYHPEYANSGECLFKGWTPEETGQERKLSFVNLLDYPDFPEVPSLDLVPLKLDLELPGLRNPAAGQAILKLDLLLPQTRPVQRPRKKTLARRHITKSSCGFVRKRIARSRHRHKGRFISKAEAEALLSQQTPPSAE